MNSFGETPLLPSLVASLAEQQITVPTEIQAQTLSPLLEGIGLVGVAETGSGKTLAYVLPMLHTLKTLENEGDAVTHASTPRGLVVVPGRELGEQVGRVFKSLTHGTRLRVRMVLGAAAKKVARRNASGPFEILVATPGRLLQLMDGGEVRLDDTRVVVFDEADQLADHGFLPVAQRIIGDCRDGVQLALFSATLPPSLEDTIRELFVHRPLRIETSGSQRLVPTLTTDNREVVDGRRFDVLAPLLAEAPDAATLLFANTREQCERIAEWLDTQGLHHVVYMGQMDRVERRRNLGRFRNGEVPLMLSTDLAARGLDIERVERVVNVHLPRDVDNYLHRAGRTARAGRPGLVINLVTERDAAIMAKLEVLQRPRS
ncbi:MAG: DEAD/DEAH box helicase [Myxococcales bacterium]|nr:DEAD/DEAH box helicase [Myxococcales bacterium]